MRVYIPAGLPSNYAIAKNHLLIFGQIIIEMSTVTSNYNHIDRVSIYSPDGTPTITFSIFVFFVKFFNCLLFEEVIEGQENQTVVLKDRNFFSIFLRLLDKIIFLMNVAVGVISSITVAAPISINYI